MTQDKFWEPFKKKKKKKVVANKSNKSLSRSNVHLPFNVTAFMIKIYKMGKVKENHVKNRKKGSLLL